MDFIGVFSGFLAFDEVGTGGGFYWVDFRMRWLADHVCERLKWY